MDVEPLVLDVNSDLGAKYIACMNLAGRFAYAGRDFVCREVSDILGAGIEEEVHNNHKEEALKRFQNIYETEFTSYSVEVVIEENVWK